MTDIRGLGGVALSDVVLPSRMLNWTPRYPAKDGITFGERRKTLDMTYVVNLRLEKQHV